MRTWILPLFLAALAKLLHSARSGPEAHVKGIHLDWRDNERKVPMVQGQLAIHRQKTASTHPYIFSVVKDYASPEKSAVEETDSNVNAVSDSSASENAAVEETDSIVSIRNTTSNVTRRFEQKHSILVESNPHPFATGFHEITAENFKQKVEDTRDTWMLEFHSGLCGACQQFTPIFDEFARSLKEKVHVHIGKVNIDEEPGLKLAEKLNALDFGVPTIRIFSNQDNLGKMILGGTDADFPDEVTVASLEQKALQHLSSRGNVAYSL